MRPPLSSRHSLRLRPTAPPSLWTPNAEVKKTALAFKARREVLHQENLAAAATLAAADAAATGAGVNTLMMQTKDSPSLVCKAEEKRSICLRARRSAHFHTSHASHRKAERRGRAAEASNGTCCGQKVAQTCSNDRTPSVTTDRKKPIDDRTADYLKEADSEFQDCQKP